MPHDHKLPVLSRSYYTCSLISRMLVPEPHSFLPHSERRLSTGPPSPSSSTSMAHYRKGSELYDQTVFSVPTTEKTPNSWPTLYLIWILPGSVNVTGENPKALYIQDVIMKSRVSTSPHLLAASWPSALLHFPSSYFRPFTFSSQHFSLAKMLNYLLPSYLCSPSGISPSWEQRPCLVDSCLLHSRKHSSLQKEWINSSASFM